MSSTEKAHKVSNDADLSRSVRERLHFTQAELAAHVLVSRNYISQIEAGLKIPSKRLRVVFKDLLAESALLAEKGKPYAGAHLKTGGISGRVEEQHAVGSDAVASRLPQKREPSTRADCEAYFAKLMDAADLSDDPNAFPVILHRLKKEFPLDEWNPPPPEESKP